MRRSKLWRIEVPHIRGCAAVHAVRTGDWTTPWSTVDEEKPFSFLNNAGTTTTAKRVPHHCWLRFCCNDTRCDARLLVHLRRMFDAIKADA